MRPYAQTYAQLIGQAVQRGMPVQDLARLADAARLAEGIYDGLYRKSGTPFLCHGMRTASIVLSEDASIDIVTAALLHAAYFLHCFKDSNRRGPRKSDRELVRRTLGTSTDELIRQYTDLPWNYPDDIEKYCKQASMHDARMRKLILLSLANELDDHMDGGEALTGKHTDPPWNCVDLARAMGYPELAGELAEVFESSRDSQYPEVVLTGKKGSYLTRRLWLANPIELAGGIWRRYRAKR